YLLWGARSGASPGTDLAYRMRWLPANFHGAGAFSSRERPLAMRSLRPRLLALAVLLAGFGAASPAAAREPQRTTGEKYALLVGVRQYNKNELRNLPYAENDVEGLAQVLLRNGYRKENVVLMTQKVGATTDTDLLPTTANIREQIKLLLQDRIE